MSKRTERFDTGFGYDVTPHGWLQRNDVVAAPRYVGADYGCDPLPDGTFRMVPTGDVVDAEEKERRLRTR